VDGYDFIADTNISLDGDGYDANPDDPGDRSQGGSTFHGSHVAGTIGAVTDNGKGVSGTGWLTSIMPLRVLGKGGAGKDYDIEQAIRFAAGLSNASGTVPRKTADIINLSLGGPTISTGFQRAIDEVRQSGVIIVAAAGNDGTSTSIFPASLGGVISVSAVDINKERASYSNYGRNVDVAAPGGSNSTADMNGDGYPDQILSTRGDDEYSTIQFDYAFSMGTSMASPHIAGVIALMKAVNPNLTPQNVDSLINSSNITEDLGLRGRDDNFGYGFVNAQKAVLAASQLRGGVIAEPAPLLVVSHGSLNFGLSDTQVRITLSNGGGGHLQIEEVHENSSGFLSIAPQAVEASSQLGNYLVTVNRSQLNSGTFTAIITIVSNVNTVRIPVILQVGDQSITGDAGYHYILLIKESTLETVLETHTTVNKGIYDFKLSGLESGTYILAAGSDFNNDGFICDLGEACGAFLTLSDPINIDIVNSSRNRVDFSTGFNVSFLSQLSVLGKAPVPVGGFARLKTQHELAGKLK
jgi:serine protease